MKIYSSFSLALFLGCLINFSYSLDSVSADQHYFRPRFVPQYRVHINYPKGVNHEKFDIKVLAEAVGSIRVANAALLYHFNASNAMSKPGFAARLTNREFEIIKKNPNVDDVDFVVEPQVHSDQGFGASLDVGNEITKVLEKWGKHMVEFFFRMGGVRLPHDEYGRHDG